MSGGRKILSALLLAVTAGLALEVSAQALGRYRIIPTSGGDLTTLARQLESVCSCTLELQGGVLIGLATPEGAAQLLSDARVGWIESATAPPPSPPVAVASAELERIDTHGSTQWKMGDYGYDGSGNIISIGGTSGDQFSYDAFGRLAEARVSNGLATPHTQAYTYDRYGNLKKITTGASPSVELNLNPNSANNRVEMSNVEFNQAGELTLFLGDTYSYDALGMVKSAVVAAASKIYIYNASDERLATVSLLNGQQGPEQHWEWTLRSPSNRVLRRFSSQVRSTGTQWQWNEDYIYAGDRLLAAEVSGDERTRRFHTDHLGTPRLVTGYGGTTLSQHTYFPFGQEIDAPANPNAERMQFTGHERDSAIVDYMHARYYATLWGRFLSVDPVLDVKNAIKQPQMWNRYAYALNNPVRFTDPTGKYVCQGNARECKVIDAAIAGMKTAAAGLKEGSDQRVKLEKAIAFFGDKGQKNGVYVRTDLTRMVAAATRTEGLITTVRVNLDYAMFQSSTGKNGSVYATEMSAVMGHEGGHGVIQRFFGMSRTGAQNRVSETEAFYTQAAVNEGFGHSSNKGIWTREGGLDENAIQKWVEIANREFCSQPGASCQ